MVQSPLDLHKHLFIKIDHEDGLDYGGIAREWFYELSHEITNPMYCLFMLRNPGSNYFAEINPSSGINPNHLVYFEFVGRIIGLALFNGKFLDQGFTKVFYKQLLNRKCDLEDIQQTDTDFYNSIVWLEENNINDSDLELYFCTEVENFGKLETIELKENGSNIRVTEDNKKEYTKLLIEWKISHGIKTQMEHITYGFTQIIPLTWLQSFSIKEIELLICGMEAYDIKDWNSNTRYRGYTSNSVQIQWFWKLVNSLDSEHHAKLLHFVTGTSRIPATGFADLIGSNGPQKFCIEKRGNPNDLPRSHTCFNRLDIPPYTSYEQLKSKLLIAIDEGLGFYEE